MHLSIVAVFALLINAVVIYAAPSSLGESSTSDPFPITELEGPIETLCTDGCSMNVPFHQKENCRGQCMGEWRSWFLATEHYRYHFIKDSRRTSNDNDIKENLGRYLKALFLQELKNRKKWEEVEVRLVGAKNFDRDILPKASKGVTRVGSGKWVEATTHRWLFGGEAFPSTGNRRMTSNRGGKKQGRFLYDPKQTPPHVPSMIPE